jgi:hypothetical protein
MLCKNEGRDGRDASTKPKTAREQPKVKSQRTSSPSQLSEEANVFVFYFLFLKVVLQNIFLPSGCKI